MIYCDYNASAPLSRNVLKFLSSGVDLFANPSASHLLAQKAQAEINTTTRFLKESLNVDEHFDVLYHSGVTEGVNTFFKGLFRQKNVPTDICFFYFATDHQAVKSCAKQLEGLGALTFELPVEETGDFNFSDIVDLINDKQFVNCSKKVLNFTWVHNESGVVWPLDLACQLKKKTGAIIHIDATQSVGKWEKFRQLRSELDIYSYSGHKFGAFKGIGWSFVKKDLEYSPLLIGGGQQGGHRGGTQPTELIISLREALFEYLKLDYYEEMESFKREMENIVLKRLGEKGAIIGESANYRNCNTVYFVNFELSSDKLVPLFDMNNLIVGTGSACSSGETKASSTLQALGYEKFARNGIRLSWAPLAKKDEQASILKIVDKVLGKKF